MPLYDYRCRTCQQVTEVRHGFGEGFHGPCPSCGAPDMARVFNAAGIVFKGSGFYVNDSRKPAAGSSEKPARETSAPADGESAKPASPAPAAPAAAPAAADAGSKKSESSAA